MENDGVEAQVGFASFIQNVKDVIKYKSVWVFGAVMFGTYGV